MISIRRARALQANADLAARLPPVTLRARMMRQVSSSHGEEGS
jgi:hypothetical protein